ncbi:acyltransferase family protein [Romboutsia sp.]|uniref:acyltransferase family protein n=1 Tax=Romboutsia sp. TaxID=1965302 RepID=UPI003F3B7C12
MSKYINYQMLILQAIGIIIVVLGHKGGLSLLTDWFPAYSFHMPLFIFISGYFYKKSSEENLFSFIKQKFNRLMIPYFIWNLFYGILANILVYKNIISFSKPITLWNLFIEPFITGHQFGLNVASWFLPALFLVQVFYILIRRTFNSIKLNNEYIFMVVFFIFGIMGVILGNKGFIEGFELTLTRTLFLVSFFQLGYFYKSKLESRDKLNNVSYFIILFAIQFFITLKYKDLNFSAAFCNNFNRSNILLPFISSITGIGFWLRVSRILVPSLKDSKTISAIGGDTFSIMMHHELVFFGINSILAMVYGYLNLTNFSIESYSSNGWYGYNILDTKSLAFYVVCGVLIPVTFKKIYYKIKVKLSSSSTT